MQQAKKVKIDTNPKRVQNRSELYKRSPGKFDQKVYVEQELYANHAIDISSKVTERERQSTEHSLQKEMSGLRRMRVKIEAQNESYGYLKQLRNAFKSEHHRREQEVINKQLRAQQAVLQAHRDKQKAEEEAKRKAEMEKSMKPWERKGALGNKDECNNGQGTAIRSQGHPIIKSEEERLQHEQLNQKDPELLRLSEREMSTLETLSTDIVKGLLPIAKLKRMIPDQEVPVCNKYPIMSTYRRNSLLPEVRKFKKQLNHDVVSLNHRIQNYFGERIPLSIYVIPESAKPHKYKLLRAIASDDFSLPPIEKNDE